MLHTWWPRISHSFLSRKNMDKKTSGKGERRKEKKMCCKKALGMHVYKRGAHVCAHSHEKKNPAGIE